MLMFLVSRQQKQTTKANNKQQTTISKSMISSMYNKSKVVESLMQQQAKHCHKQSITQQVDNQLSISPKPHIVLYLLNITKYAGNY
mmetsp:Transcript_13125/g.23835  ORF Transcript_13125/g.23835 Transcript_13125/m.23835 type:complete len:86 (+) Transcript_13125:105-362(+)